MRLLTIMRGLPGAGKSTEARRLFEGNELNRILSTDDFFLDKEGNYNFDPEKIAHAHVWNQGRCAGMMMAEIPHIVIDNTCCEYWEMTAYVKLAAKYGYNIEVAEPDTGPHRDVIKAIQDLRCCVVELTNRSTHKVDFDTIMGMACRYTPSSYPAELLENGNYDEFIQDHRPPWEE